MQDAKAQALSYLHIYWFETSLWDIGMKNITESRDDVKAGQVRLSCGLPQAMLRLKVAFMA